VPTEYNILSKTMRIYIYRMPIESNRQVTAATAADVAARCTRVAFYSNHAAIIGLQPCLVSNSKLANVNKVELLY